MAEELKLFGATGSPFNHRVEVALKLKGVEYEYVEEDVYGTKSTELLKYHSVHKKIPILLHNGKPLAEFLVILDYVDDAFGGYPLLPKDQYEGGFENPRKRAGLQAILRRRGGRIRRHCCQLLELWVWDFSRTSRT